MWAHVGSWLWLVAVFVLGVLATKLKDSLRKLYDHLERKLLDWLVGRDLFTRRALRNYLRRLYDDHRDFIVSFQPGSSSECMDMLKVYVKLSLAVGSGQGGRKRPASLADSRRAVVLGAPGAGKTMLLRHTALAWVHQRYRPDDPVRRTWYGRRRLPRADLADLTDIPVVIPLFDVRPDHELRQHIVDHLAACDFRNAGRWLDRMLDDGRIALYFDGLDEVSSAQRPQVIETVQKFLSSHRKCRAVITCRVAVYNGEFNETFGSPLHVEPFDDQLISRFLHGYPWPDDLEDNTADQLLGVLRDTPQLMSLAGNPLLLTMIAYLHSTVYAGTDERLPHTRADFYKQVIGSLLGDRNRPRNVRYSPPVKLAALQRVALAAQDVPSDAHDRLALPEKDVLAHIEAALVDQRRSPEKAQEVLEEIVERTGLLLSIDGGVRYTFAHLTLQEYLAAAALAADPRGLLDRYARDPAVWRETVRLWCGVAARDCSDVVREVFGRDPVLAFQCLADAHVVDPELADRIIGRFRDGMGTALHDMNFDEIIAAFGVVAADRRAPGPAVFQMLYEAAQDEQNQNRAYEAMLALAATHVSRAAEMLIDLLPTAGVGAEFALMLMGDLAVPALQAAARKGLPGAVPVLWQIRTVSSAQVLCALLLRSGPDCGSVERRTRYAAYLGDLLRDPEIEKALDEGEPLAPAPEDFSWVWRLFALAEGGALVSVVSWIAWALVKGDPETIPEEVVIDPRITAALAVVLSGVAEDSVDPVVSRAELKSDAAELAQIVQEGRASSLFTRDGSMAWHIGSVLRDPESRGVRCGESDDSGADGVRVFSYEELSDLGIRALQSRRFVPSSIAYLKQIPVRMRLHVESVMLDSYRVSPETWAHASERSPRFYVYRSGWHSRVVLGVCGALSAAAGVRAGLDMFGSDPWGPVWLALLVLIQIVCGWLILLFRGVVGDPDRLMKQGFLAVRGVVRDAVFLDREFWTALANVGLLPAVLVYAFAAGQGLLGTVGAVSGTALLVLLTAAVAIRGHCLDERSRADRRIEFVRRLVRELRQAADARRSE